MKKIRVKIFTEEYAVNIFIGKKDELIKAGARYTTYSPKTIKKELEGRRGVAFNLFPGLNPLIIIDGDLPYVTAIATLAHEASHSVDHIMDHLGINDTNGEFRGHGIGAIMRQAGKLIKLK
jgi:hypothetical protein